MVRADAAGLAFGRTGIACAVAFVAAMAMGVLGLAMTFYLRERYGASGTQIGGFTAFWALCYILGCNFARPLANQVPPKVAVAFSLAGILAGTMLVHFCGSLFWAFVFNGCYAVCTSFFWPMLMTWVARIREGEGLNKRLSAYNVAWSSGTIVGPVLGGWLSEGNVVRPLVFAWALFFVAGLTLLFAILFLPRIRADRRVSSNMRGGGATNEKPTLLRYPAWIGAFSAYALVSYLATIFPLWAREDLGLGKTLIGWLLLVRTFATSAGFWVMGRTMVWHYSSRQMLWGQILLATVTMFLAYAATPLWLGLALLGAGVLSAMSYFNSMFHGAAGSPDRVRSLTIHETILNSGILMGNLAGGVLYQSMSFEYGCRVFAALILAVALAQAALCRRASRIEGRR